MANNPPPLPHEILRRVLSVASFDGRLLMIVAGSLAILHAAAHQQTGAIVGILVAGAGALELHGAGLLRSGDSRGTDWLVRSQLLLLAVMLVFAATQLMRTPQEVLDEIKRSPDAVAVLKESPIPELKFAQLFNGFVYITVGVVTFIYQGLMALYYYRRRNIIATAIDEGGFDPLDNERD